MTRKAAATFFQLTFRFLSRRIHIPLLVSIKMHAPIAALTLAILAAPIYAQTAGTEKLMYLTDDQIDPGRLLPPPPKDGSENQRKELAEVKHLVQTRTAARYEQAKWDNEHEDPAAFAATLGLEFDLKKLPATAKLLAAVMNDQHIAAGRAKEFFHRKFPVAVEQSVGDYHAWSCDADVKKPADRPLRSYPSGHSTMSYSVGVVLAALMPEKAQAILARAADYAYSREVCGDHYHADIEASHALGSALGMMLLNNRALQPQVQAAKAELRANHIAMRR
jgi:acid phosphatase (class A)